MLQENEAEATKTKQKSPLSFNWTVWKWYDAITARKNGTATQEQIELLDKGHWKE